MLRRWYFQLAAVPILLLVLAGCSGGNGDGPQDVQADSTNDAADIIDCPDGLVHWPGYGVCAPFIPECEAWEMPTVERTCVVVGPRACPKMWDPDADLDCEPGDLMPCKEGFVLTEDEVACVPWFSEDCGELEISIIGDGCQRIGPSWGEPGASLFDDCGEGQLAFPGGGCLVVGPRACPQLWDPEDDTPCVALAPQDCPTGWDPSEDGIACHHPSESCGPGELADAQGDCSSVIPPETECPAGPFPDIPGGGGDVVYVSETSACTQSCGTPQSPYPSIQAAVDGVATGGVVLVGPGTYAGGLLIEKSVQVHGLCAARVRVTEEILVVPNGDTKILQATVAIVGAQEVVLSALEIQSSVAGIAVVEAQDVRIHRVEIAGAHGVSLYVDSASSGELEESWIHDSVTGFGQLPEGRGIWVGGGSSWSVADCRFDSVQRVGVEAQDPGTEVTLEHVVVRETKPTTPGGAGILAGDGAQVFVHAGILQANATAGVKVVSGGRAEFRESSILETVGNGADVRDPGSYLLLERTRVSGSTPFDETEFIGAGLFLLTGAEADVRGCLLENNTYSEVYIQHQEPEVDIIGSLLRDTQPLFDQGSGVIAFKGADVLVRGSVIERSWGSGVIASDEGTLVELETSVVRNTLPDTGGNGVGSRGTGVTGESGVELVVTDCLIEGITTHGLEIKDAPTHLQMTDSVVRETGSADEQFLNLVFTDGAKGSLAGCVIENGGRSGVVVLDAGSEVMMNRCIIRDQKSAQPMTVGAVAQEGGHLAMADCLVSGIQGVGVLSVMPGTRVDLTDTVVRDISSPAAPDFTVSGFTIAYGGEASASRILIEDCTEAGVFMEGDGSDLWMAESLVQRTRPGLVQQAAGVQIQDAANASIRNSLIDANIFTGLAVYGTADVTVAASTVRGTLATPDGAFGTGIAVGYGGGTTTLCGLLVETSATGGIAVLHEETTVSLSHSLIRDQYGLEGNWRGFGMAVLGGAEVKVRDSCFLRNRTLGIGAGAGTHLDLERVSILETLAGGNILDLPDGTSEVQAFGDGLSSINGTLRLQDLLIALNDRSGIFLTGASTSGEIRGSAIQLNMAYGLITEHCEDSIVLEDSQIESNGLDMDCGPRCNVTSDPGMIPVVQVDEIEFF